MKKYDDKGNFIRKYVPELRYFPDHLIYEPWKASAKEQSRARCIIGVDYPAQIVTKEEIQKIFENAKMLLKKFHNVDLDLQMQQLDNTGNNNLEIEKSNCKFTLKEQIPKIDNFKFRGTVKSSTRIDTLVDGENHDLISQDRINYRPENNEGLDIEDQTLVKVKFRKRIVESSSKEKTDLQDSENSKEKSSKVDRSQEQEPIVQV